MKTSKLIYVGTTIILLFAGNKFYKNSANIVDSIPLTASTQVAQDIETVFEDQNDLVLHQVEELLDFQKYDKALELLSSISNASRNNPKILLCEGQIYMYKKDFNKAITFFDKVIYSDNKSDIVNTAIWLKSMAFMKNDDKADARVYLEFLELTGSSYYQNKARKMLSFYSTKS